MAEKYESYDCGDTGHVIHTYENFWSGQTFTPSEKHSCLAVAMRIRQNGIAPAEYKMRIQQCSEGLPIVPPVVLAEVTFDGRDIISTAPGEMKLLTLDTPCSLWLKKYSLVLYCPSGGDTNNCIMWYYQQDTDPYPNPKGQSMGFLVPGGWYLTGIGDDDAGFEEWGEPIAPVEGAMGKARGFDFRGRGFRP